MRLLLDTQVFLWFLSDEARIPEDARTAIESASNAVLVSAVSVWEIAIKASIGRLQISHADVVKLPRLIEATGFDDLPVDARHASAVVALPMHHRDPFDRLLVAQARVEDLTLVTTDPAIRAYDVRVL
jgi:PIN domain nuclease of toxin-antitoxin system